MLSGENSHHMAEAIFKAFAKALDMATAYDERISDVLSTKGSLIPFVKFFLLTYILIIEIQDTNTWLTYFCRHITIRQYREKRKLTDLLW